MWTIYVSTIPSFPKKSFQFSLCLKPALSSLSLGIEEWKRTRAVAVWGGEGSSAATPWILSFQSSGSLMQGSTANPRPTSCWYYPRAKSWTSELDFQLLSPVAPQAQCLQNWTNHLYQTHCCHHLTPKLLLLPHILTGELHHTQSISQESYCFCNPSLTPCCLQEKTQTIIHNIQDPLWQILHLFCHRYLFFSLQHYNMCLAIVKYSQVPGIQNLPYALKAPATLVHQENSYSFFRTQVSDHFVSQNFLALH